MSPPDSLRFLTEAEVPAVAPGDAVFREARLGRGVFFLLMLVITVGWCGGLGLLIHEASGGTWAMVGVLALIVLVLLFATQILWQAWVRSGLPSAWTLRTASDGLYIKLRSFLNADFPAEDRVVLFVPRRCVRDVQGWTHRSERPESDGRGKVTHFERFIDFRLTVRDLSAVKQALAEEGRRRSPGGSRFSHVSVQVHEGGVLRVVWRGANGALKPGMTAALVRLGQDYAVQHPGQSRQTALEDMARPDKESLIVDLAQSGDTFAAIALAREVYGYTVTEAKIFVDELTGQPKRQLYGKGPVKPQ